MYAFGALYDTPPRAYPGYQVPVGIEVMAFKTGYLHIIIWLMCFALPVD